jgi:hypothetical protein
VLRRARITGGSLKLFALLSAGNNQLPLETVCQFVEDIAEVTMRDGSHLKVVRWTETDNVDYDLETQFMDTRLLASFAFSTPDRSVVIRPWTTAHPMAFLGLMMPHLTHLPDPTKPPTSP